MNAERDDHSPVSGLPGGSRWGNTPRVGSLCTGYGGLDLAISTVMGGSTVWTAENDKHARVVTEARFAVPNHGDIKKIDWSAVEPIDVLAAGYPCQPFSQAGKRQGADDPRHLWPDVRDAIRHLRPRLVVLENVQGHLRLGFPQVLADLADIGFDATWTLLRASEVGACHQRARLFVLAHPADPHGIERERRGERGQLAGASGADQGDGREWQRDGDAASDSTAPPTYADVEGPQGAEPESSGGRGGPAHGATSDAQGQLLTHEQVRSDGAAQPLGAIAGTGDRTGDGRPAEGALVDRRGADLMAWGVYEPAIRRHERVLGRPHPSPLEDSQERHSARFVEWMMMLPEGWVTDLVSRNQAMKILGNGVVPRCAEAAVNHLLARIDAQEAAA